MTVNVYGIVKYFDVFKNQSICMCIIKYFKSVDPIHSLFKSAWEDSMQALSHEYAFFE